MPQDSGESIYAAKHLDVSQGHLSSAPKAGHTKASLSDVSLGGIWPVRWSLGASSDARSVLQSKGCRLLAWNFSDRAPDSLRIPWTEKWPKTGHADDWVNCAGRFQVTVCGVTFCPFSGHQGGHNPECLKSKVQTTSKHSCHVNVLSVTRQTHTCKHPVVIGFGCGPIREGTPHFVLPCYPHCQFAVGAAFGFLCGMPVCYLPTQTKPSAAPSTG